MNTSIPSEMQPPGTQLASGNPKYSQEYVWFT